MRHYLVHLIFATVLTALSAGLFSWWAEPIHGDLTRIGRWSEHDFGPNAAPPVIQVKAAGSSLNNATAMVLGDSFSERNLWQSIFEVKTNYIVKTFNYFGIKNCVQEWVKEVIKNPAVRIVIIETIEREFVARFDNKTPVPLCSKGIFLPLEINTEVTEAARPMWPPTVSFAYLSTTATNTVRSNLFNENYSDRFRTVNAPLHADCASFSNRRNNRILYLADDDVKNQWQDDDIKNAVTNVLHIQNEVKQHGKEFIFMLAPDKSSVYRHCLATDKAKLKQTKINQLLIEAGVNAPNMQSIFAEQANTVVDLYDPDNTHWSTAGYILAGEIMSQHIAPKSKSIN